MIGYMWEDAERIKVQNRIIGLSEVQIAELLEESNLQFPEDELLLIAHEIKERGHDSVYLEMLMHRSSSKEDLYRWLEFLEDKS